MSLPEQLARCGAASQKNPPYFAAACRYLQKPLEQTPLSHSLLWCEGFYGQIYFFFLVATVLSGSGKKAKRKIFDNIKLEQHFLGRDFILITTELPSQCMKSPSCLSSLLPVSLPTALLRLVTPEEILAFRKECSSSFLWEMPFGENRMLCSAVLLLFSPPRRRLRLRCGESREVEYQAGRCGGLRLRRLRRGDAEQHPACYSCL